MIYTAGNNTFLLQSEIKLTWSDNVKASNSLCFLKILHARSRNALCINGKKLLDNGTSNEYITNSWTRSSPIDTEAYELVSRRNLFSSQSSSYMKLAHYVLVNNRSGDTT